MKIWMTNFFDLMGQIRWMAVLPLLSGLTLVLMVAFHDDTAHIEVVGAVGFLNLTLAILSLDTRA